MNQFRSHNLRTLKVENMNSSRRNIRSWIACICLAVALVTMPALLQAQEATAPPLQDGTNPPSGDYVSRAEYDKLKADHDAMKKEMDALKTAVRQMANGAAPAAPAEGPAPATKPSEGKQVVTTTQ